MKEHVTYKIYWIVFILILLYSATVSAQDDLMDELSKSMPKEREFVYATFKGTRVINLHTVETVGKKNLEFRIAHRFGDFSSGGRNLWGLDGPATIQFHFDYGITDRFTVGVGRASFNKMFDAFAKYKLIRQTVDNRAPVTVTALGSTTVTSDVDPHREITGTDNYQNVGNRVAYLAQVAIARKINSKLSLQLTPSFIHYNLSSGYGDQNDIYAAGLTSRYKISSRAALTGEYIYRINNYSSNLNRYTNVLSLGIDLETGGHVFQVFVTNSVAINEVSVIPYTESHWSQRQIRLGFNIARTFGGHKTKKA